MKKMRVWSLLLVLTLLLSLLSACQECSHEWKAANCAQPKTCKLCGITEGEPTEEHQWRDATTDAPKTCAICRLTDGDIIDVDSRFQTKNCKDIFGNWEATYEINGAEKGLHGITIPMKITMYFCNDGEVQITKAPVDPTAFETELSNFLSNMTYEKYAEVGIDKTQADAACMAQHNKTVTAYCQEQAKRLVSSMMSETDMIYYVDEGYLFVADDWDSAMDKDAFELINGNLMLDDNELGQTLEFRKIAR